MKRDRALLATGFLLRFVSGLMFMQHGGQKIFDWFGGIPQEFGGHPDLLSQTGIGGVIEFACGLFVMIGLFTRPAAFIASGTMAVAYFQFHQKNAFWPNQNGGEPAVLYSFIFLFFVAYGGGAWSLDGFLQRKKEKKAQ